MIEIYYKDYKPRVGDIGIVDNDSWISRKIKRVTRSIVNHCFIFVKDANNSSHIVVAEAEKNGIEFNGFYADKYKGGNNKHKQIYILRPIFDIKATVLSELAHSLDYKKYDFWGLALQFILQKTGRWLQKTSKGDKYFYCSEYVAYIYNQLYNLFPEWYKLNPKDIFRNYDKSKFVLIKIVKK